MSVVGLGVFFFIFLEKLHKIVETWIKENFIWIPSKILGVMLFGSIWGHPVLILTLLFLQAFGILLHVQSAFRRVLKCCMFILYLLELFCMLFHSTYFNQNYTHMIRCEVLARHTHRIKGTPCGVVVLGSCLCVGVACIDLVCERSSPHV